MAIQSLIIKNRKLATWFMSSRKSSFWENVARKKAVKSFREAAERVPAYKKVLQENNIKTVDINLIEDFKKLPIIDKKNYLSKYPIEELCLDGKLEDKYLIDRSSGYSGASLFWPRSKEEDIDYPNYMKLAYEQFYQVDKKSTLMIITLALGTWVGGEKISWATREIALRNKLPFTVITPGLNLSEIIEIVQSFKDKYEQLVLVGYPPFIKTIIDEGTAKGLDWKKINIKIGLGGEGYSEDWREYIRQKIGLPENDLMGIAGGYGAADLGMSVGREYPISVLIRKLATDNKKLAKDLFGQEDIPSFCQYSPSTFYIEEINNELVFTCKPGIPLVRYNIHDRGGILSYNKVLEILASYKIDPIKLLKEKGYTDKDIWKLPFFYVYGRSDGTIAISGGKIYVENIKKALDDPQVVESNTGNFRMSAEYDKEQNQSLVIKVELKRGNEINSKLKEKYQKVIVQTLIKVNSEYAILYRANRKSVTPEIELCKFSDSDHFNEKTIKNKYV